MMAQGCQGAEGGLLASFDKGLSLPDNLCDYTPEMLGLDFLALGLRGAVLRDLGSDLVRQCIRGDAMELRQLLLQQQDRDRDMRAALVRRLSSSSDSSGSSSGSSKFSGSGSGSSSGSGIDFNQLLRGSQQSVLHLAAARGHLEVVRTLLHFGAVANVVNKVRQSVSQSEVRTCVCACVYMCVWLSV